MRHWLAMAALAGALGLAQGAWIQDAAAQGTAAQGADPPAWSILEYDADGNPISTLEGDAPTLAPPAALPAPEEGAGDPDGSAARDAPPAPRDFDKPHIPGEIMVVGAGNAEVEALRRLDFVLIERLRLGNLGLEAMRLRLPAGMSVDDAAALIGREFPSLTVDTNDLFEQSGGPPPGDYSRRLSGWGEAPATCGQGLRIGMVDSFVDARAPIFDQGQVRYRGFASDRGEPAVDDHGTGVAALLVGRGGEGVARGLLPGARLYAASIFEIRDGRQVGNLGALLRGLDWIAGQGAQIVNMSIAGSGNAIMTIALNRALDRGMLVVAAAGNRGPGAPPAWPAAHPRVIAVTALGSDLSIYPHANRGRYIDFAAPGVGVRTLGAAGPVSQSGTSFAAPFVTAMAAIHLLAGFEPDGELIRASLRRYAVDLGEQGPDPVFGHGLVRLRPPC